MFVQGNYFQTSLKTAETIHIVGNIYCSIVGHSPLYKDLTVEELIVSGVGLDVGAVRRPVQVGEAVGLSGLKKSDKKVKIIEQTLKPRHKLTFMVPEMKISS